MLAGRLTSLQKEPQERLQSLGQNAGIGHSFTYSFNQQIVIMHLLHARHWDSTASQASCLLGARHASSNWIGVSSHIVHVDSGISQETDEALPKVRENLAE